MRAVFAQETEKMRLGRAERIDGAVRPLPRPASQRAPVSAAAPARPPRDRCGWWRGCAAEARDRTQDCWTVNKVPGGLSSFPTYSVEFEKTGLIEFHPIHYMFNHPRVANPTHYCYGALRSRVRRRGAGRKTGKRAPFKQAPV
jgi:hypothetical protein